MSLSRRPTWAFIVALLLTALLAPPACQSTAAPGLTPAGTAAFTALTAAESNVQTPSPIAQLTPPVATPTAIPSVTPTLPPTPSPTPNPPAFWLDPALPAGLRAAVQLPPGAVLTTVKDQADYRLQVGQAGQVSRWFFLLVAAFPSLVEDIPASGLRQAWETGRLQSTGGRPVLMSAETLQALSSLWGQPAPPAVEVLPASDLLAAAWENHATLAVVPFEALEPRWKIITLDGQSPLSRTFNPQTYPLTLPAALQAQPGAPPGLQAAQLGLPASNFDPQKLSRVLLTGVTALVRGTALTMQARGITYPAQDILPWLVQADILHISNEIPFFSQCPPAELHPAEILFCSPPEFIQLLDVIGTDVVELDGDHFGDFGAEAMAETLALYQQRAWPYYGGGATSLEARQAVLLEDHGNRFAFIGCNAKGIAYYATATQSTPGAVPCDFAWLEVEIARLKKAGYLVIATFQHNEYSTYQAQPDLVRDFRRIAQAGAAIVSGSQAHQPHGMEFLGDSFIHYGLGNLFFDQYRFVPGPEYDRAFLDRHLFYDGRYLGTELLTIKFVDLARSRPTTPEERINLLQDIFTASGW